MTFEYLTSRELYDIFLNGSREEKESLKYVEMEGWVRTNRNNNSIGFIEFNDGSYFKNIQIVYDKKNIDNFEQISKIKNGSCISIIGEFIITNSSKQPFEINLKKLEVLGEVEDDYPLQKKRHSFEFLRDIAHLRVRTNTFSSVFRVRSVLSIAIHEFFYSQGFVYLHSPIITSNDAEGAGETFTVTTRADNKYEKDFFAKKASLSVSGQLNAEAFALGLRDVYTFGPTFRAENSNTIRHASEFWMIEPEMAFCDLEENMFVIEDLVKFCIEFVLKNAKEEMNFFNERIEPGIIERLQKLTEVEFKRMEYSEAIEVLKQALAKGSKFENDKIFLGMDLQSEHERYLCEEFVKGPVFLINYPKEIKAFYMRLNDDNKTVAACEIGRASCRERV